VILINFIHVSIFQFEYANSRFIIKHFKEFILHYYVNLMIGVMQLFLKLMLIFITLTSSY